MCTHPHPYRLQDVIKQGVDIIIVTILVLQCHSESTDVTNNQSCMNSCHQRELWGGEGEREIGKAKTVFCVFLSVFGLRVRHTPHLVGTPAQLTFPSSSF